MSGSLIPISDEQAKLGQEILKTLRGLGSFIEKALGGTPEDLIAYFGGDRLRVRRAENLVRLFEQARRRLADWNVEQPIAASLSVALPILQGAADEDREELVDLWARLLANAMDPKLNNVRHTFIDAVKAMDPPDALVLRYLNSKNIVTICPDHREERDQMTGIDTMVGTIAGKNRDDIETSIRHLTALLLLDKNQTTLTWHVNAVCRVFMRACYPEAESG